MFAFSRMQGEGRGGGDDSRIESPLLILAS